jgi:hypothetical protein
MFFSVSRRIPGQTVFASHCTFFSFLAIILVLHCVFPILQVFQCFSIYSRSYSVCFSFSIIFSFWPYSITYIVHFSFSMFWSVSRLIPGQTLFILIFHICHFSRHIPVPTLCVSHFPCFSVFLAILQVLSCEFLFSFIFQFYHLIPGPAVYISQFSPFSVFLTIFPVLHFVRIIFLVFQFFRQIPGHTMCIYHFSLFSLFVDIFNVLQCVILIFHVFQYFSPNSRSYSTHFLFSRFFSVSRQITGQTVFVFLFQRFSVF